MRATFFHIAIKQCEFALAPDGVYHAACSRRREFSSFCRMEFLIDQNTQILFTFHQRIALEILNSNI